MIYNYYDETNDIITIILEKDSNAKEIIQNIEFWFANYKPLENRIKILVDNSKANVRISQDDMKELNAKIEITCQDIKEVRHAVLVSNPIITALVTLMSNFRNTAKIKTKAFSTKEAAIEWLKL